MLRRISRLLERMLISLTYGRHVYARVASAAAQNADAHTLILYINYKETYLKLSKDLNVIYFLLNVSWYIVATKVLHMSTKHCVFT